MTTERDSRGVDMTTLVITAIASAAAAYACSKVWAPGTLPSAALTPVLVALIKETLQRPKEVMTRAVPPVREAVRSARIRSDEAPRRREHPREEPTRVAPSAIAERPSSSSISTRRRLAIITGLLGFVLAAVLLTLPELVAGGSASGGGRETTLFGGETKDEQRERRSPTTTAPARSANPQQRTVTVPPPTKAAPVPTTTTPPPASKTPVPPTTTPAPPTPIQP